MAAENSIGQHSQVAVSESTDPFEALYRHPTIPSMRELSPVNLERFVKHVLTHAGYDVRHTGPFFRRGVDLELHTNQGTPKRRLGGVECKKYNRKLPVGREPVQTFGRSRGLEGGIPRLPDYHERLHTTCARRGTGAC